MIVPLFPTLIEHSSISSNWNKEVILKLLEEYFQRQLRTGIVERDLHKQKEFEPIVQFMNERVAEYWQALNYTHNYPIELSQLWANRFDNGVSYPLHNDSPAVISTVFYVQKDSAEAGNIYFKDPKESIVQTQPLEETRRHNPFHEVDVRTGDLICFPSYLEHGIKTNETNLPRYSIAGLYELKGLNILRRLVK